MVPRGSRHGGEQRVLRFAQDDKFRSSLNVCSDLGQVSLDATPIGDLLPRTGSGAGLCGSLGSVYNVQRWPGVLPSVEFPVPVSSCPGRV